MKKKVVVQNTLEGVRDYLGEKGFDVRTMYLDSTLRYVDDDQYDAIIVSDRNDLHLADNITSNPAIIEVKGLTPEQVYNKILTKEHNNYA